jgi:hypothetical protein
MTTRQKEFYRAGAMFEKPYEERTERGRGYTMEGICWFFPKDHAVSLRLRNSIGSILGTSSDQFILPCRISRGGKHFDPINDIYRAMLCYFMAAMSDEDFEEMSK